MFLGMCDMALGGYQGIVEPTPMIFTENEKKSENLISDISNILSSSHSLELKSRLNSKFEVIPDAGKFNFSQTSFDPAKRFIYFAKTKEVEILWFETIKV